MSTNPNQTANSSPPSSPAEGTPCPTSQQLQIKLLRSHGLHSVADEYEYTLRELSAANRALVEAYERCAKICDDAAKQHLTDADICHDARTDQGYAAENILRNKASTCFLVSATIRAAASDTFERKVVSEQPKWDCMIGTPDEDHDWHFVSDWYGDPGVINGTGDCSRWECRACGKIDHETQPPSYDDDIL